MPAIASADFIAEVEGAVSGGSPARRARMLRQVAGLFLSDAARLNEQQIGIFDEVIVRLVDRAEPQSLAHLSLTLADVPAAPREAMRRLACHEQASVAAPILRNSKALSEIDLTEIASDRGQQHLFAIANRTNLGEALTDALLKRADTNVCRALASNPGARFSASGYSTLAAQAVHDDDIADSLARRPDTPAAAFGEFPPKVTTAVRARVLKLAAPKTRGAIQAAIQGIESQPGTGAGTPTDYSEAKSIVLALNNDGKLGESAVNRFAIHQEHNNLIAALALLATVEIEILEPLMKQSDGCGLMIACRASRLNWNTALAVVTHRKNARQLSPRELEHRREAFEALSLSVAQWTIRFGSIQDIADKFNMVGADT
jgi:uncharacterized protein (DUF2336 family)